MNTDDTQSIQLTRNEERLAFAMQLLGDKNRFKMFKLMMAQDDLCVSEMASQLSISVSGVSQHFRQFELVGLVEKHRTGQKICYDLNQSDPLVQQLLTIVRTVE